MKRRSFCTAGLAALGVAAFPYRRLAAASGGSKRYDPNNLFRLNANIKPAA